MKVLLVEDEAIVRLALKSLVNWEAHGINMELQSENGKEALDILKRQKDIDVVITDINMPVMNGLELIKKINELDIEVNIIVLSAYDDYNLVRQSFKLGVEDYILKTEMEPENVINMLKNIKKSKGVKTNQENNLFIFKQNRRCLRDWLEQKNKNLELYPNTYLNLKYTRYVVFSIWIDNYKQIKAQYDMKSKELSKMVVNGIKQIIDKEKQGEVVDLSSRDYAVIYSIDDVSVSKIRERCNYFISKCRYLLSQYLDISISVGVSTVKSDKVNIPKQYQEAFRNVKLRYVMGKGKTIFPDALNGLNRTKTESIIGKEDKLIEYLEVLDKQKINEEITKILSFIGRFDVRSIEELYPSYMELIFIINYYFSESQVKKDEIFEHNTNFYKMIKKCETKKEIETWIVNWVNNIVDYLIHNKSDECSIIIKRVKHYIDKNYKEKLNLETVGEYVGISASHLSSLFTKETGETFIKYLTHVRIENAKSLLSKTNYKIYEVSDKVGYVNVEHFSRIFRKFVGMSPKQYKNKG